MTKTVPQAQQKNMAAQSAVKTLFEEGSLRSGIALGLGTGSTAMPAVEAIADLIKTGRLSNIKAVCTSFQTLIACEELGIPVFQLNSPEINGRLMLAIDGADRIDPDLRLIKGGGAALLQEKLVEYNSNRLVIVADESKLAPHLGTDFPLPVEIIREARIPVIRELEKLGAACTVREGVRKCGPVITDNGNMIIDCLWTEPVDPAYMEAQINAITGVVENGFFTRIRPTVFVARSDGRVQHYH